MRVLPTMLAPIGADITRKSLAVDGANVSALQLRANIL
jgi:hypothetical protein